MALKLTTALSLALAQARALPQPTAFWAFQEPTGSPRVSSGAFAYALVDANASVPIIRADGGVFGPYSAGFPVTPGNNSQRLRVDREDGPAITSAIAGPNATVTLMSWIYRTQSDTNSEGMVAGVWNEYLKARQYAIFTNLGACDTAPVYHAGLAAHISANGGPTPGQRFCITRACDPHTLPADAWHCLANVYNGTHILAYVNGTVTVNANATREDNPFYYPEGIYSPEAAGAPGAEFGVGANYVNHTVGGPPDLDNRFQGRVGGLAVWAQALSGDDVAAACAQASGFGHLAPHAAREAWART